MVSAAPGVRRHGAVANGRDGFGRAARSWSVPSRCASCSARSSLQSASNHHRFSASRRSTWSEYASAKSGLLGLSRAAAAQLAEHDINVNCVAPGLTVTPTIQSKMPPEHIERLVNNSAALAVFCCFPHLAKARVIQVAQANPQDQPPIG